MQNCCPEAVATIMGPSQGGFADRFRYAAAVWQSPDSSLHKPLHGSLSNMLHNAEHVRQ